MKDKELDILLKYALKPEYEPDVKLNNEILALLKTKSEDIHSNAESYVNKKNVSSFRMKKPFIITLRAAAVILIIFSVGTAGVYAANYLLRKAIVTEHGISVGNEEYVDDDALAEPFEEVPEEKVDKTHGGASDKWLTKEVVLTNGTYQNTYYTYSNYADATEDTRLANLFSEPIGESTDTTYVETIELADGKEKEDGYKNYELDSFFKCGEGTVFVSQSVMEGVDADAAHSVSLGKTDNERTYISGTGYEFTLVDDVATENGTTRTYVMVSYNDNIGYMYFENMSEKEIHSVLDKVLLQ